ncbi:MAG: hypothetical protein ACTSW1_14250 [Candidatus Hodarchaeales archaeon]
MSDKNGHDVNMVPLIWSFDTYAFNDHIHNFVPARNSIFMVAYAYSDNWIYYTSSTSTTFTTETNTSSSNTAEVSTTTSEPPSINITSGFSLVVLLFTTMALSYRHKRK